MAVSLRAVVLVIVIIVAAVSAVTIFFPLNTATGAAVDDLVTQLRVSTSRELVQLTAAQFDPSRTLASNLLQHFRLGTLNPYDGSNLTSFIPTLCSFATSTPYSPLFGMWNDDFAGCLEDGTALYREPTTGNYNYAKTSPPYRALNKSLYVLNSPNYKVTARSWFRELKNRTGGGWSSFLIRPGSPPTSSVIVGAPFFSPVDGSFVGVVGVSMWSLNLIKALRAVTIAQTGRAMVYDASTGYFLAGNFNQSSVIQTASAALRLTWVNDTTDALIAAALSAMGGQQGLMEMPQSSYAGSMPYGDSDTAYLDVAPITDSLGLNLRVLTVIRRSDFTGSIDEQRKVAIGIAAAVVGVLAILSAAFVWWITAPLSEVADSMHISKSMGDEALGAPMLSRLSEILAIQVAYGDLCAELKRVRSYLPESILRRLDGVESDECERSECESLQAHTDKRRSVSEPDCHAPGPQTSTSTRLSAAGSGDGAGSGGAAAGSVGRGMAAIEAALAPTTRRVTVVALNMRGTHGHVARCGATEALSELCGRYLDIVHDAAKATRGVVQLMHGDRVFVAFNASLRVASHALMGVEAAAAVTKRVRSELGIEMTAGVATGDAVVGLLGNAAMKQFSVVGRPFVHAAVLERLCQCKALLPQLCAGIDGVQGRSLPLLTDRATLSSAGFTMAMRAVDIVALPHTTRPQMIATVLSEAELEAFMDVGDRRTAAADGSPLAAASHGGGCDSEWMYELSRAIASNVFSSYTEAMDSFAAGDVATAMTKLRAVTAMAMQPLVVATRSRFTQLAADGHPDVDALASELGPFYHNWCSNSVTV